MPCIFCVAVFAMLAGAVTTVVLDQMESRLATIATGPLSRSVNSASVARFDTTVAVPGAGSAGRSIPVAVTVFPGEQYQAPRSWAERAYPNLIYFNEVDRGGHFAAWEEPELFAHEIRAGFRSLRT